MTMTKVEAKACGKRMTDDGWRFWACGKPAVWKHRFSADGAWNYYCAKHKRRLGENVRLVEGK